MQFTGEQVLYVAGVAGAAFAAGFGVYHTILKVAGRTTVPCERKKELDRLASDSPPMTNGVVPVVRQMNLELLVNDNTIPAWEEILPHLSPLVANGKKAVRQTIEMVRRTRASEGEVVIYWKRITDSDKFILKIAGSYREQVPVPDQGSIEQVFGICGTSNEHYSLSQLKEAHKVDMRITQIGGNDRLPFFITISLRNGRPVLETVDVRTHLDPAEAIVVARARLE